MQLLHLLQGCEFLVTPLWPEQKNRSFHLLSYIAKPEHFTNFALCSTFVRPQASQSVRDQAAVPRQSPRLVAPSCDPARAPTSNGWPGDNSTLRATNCGRKQPKQHKTCGFPAGAASDARAGGRDDALGAARGPCRSGSALSAGARHGTWGTTAPKWGKELLSGPTTGPQEDPECGETNH